MELDINGTKLFFGVYNFNPDYKKDQWDEYWCQVSLVIMGKHFRYDAEDEEILLSCEVLEIRDALGELLDGKLNERKEIDFVEPNLQIVLDPSGFMELKISLDDGIGDQFYTVEFGEGEIAKLHDYLVNLPSQKDEYVDFVHMHDDRHCDDDDMYGDTDYELVGPLGPPSVWCGTCRRHQYSEGSGIFYDENLEDNPVSLDDAEKLFFPTIRERGQEYFAKRHVRKLAWFEDEFDLDVFVRGSEKGVEYLVRMNFNDQNEITWLRCNCPCEFHCKHQYAAILKIRRKYPKGIPRKIEIKA